MRTLRLVVAYDGTCYAGWQRQANGVSVQEVLEQAFAPLWAGAARRPVVHGASRTDAGVHARGQVASIRVPFATPADAVHRALNVRLPADVRVLEVVEAPPGFHAQFASIGKHYRYRIATGPVLLPFERWFVWHVPHALDVVAMRAAADLLVGRHDFASFQGRGSAIVDTVRRVSSVAVRRIDDEITVDITGDGFLRHMVRAIVGTLVDVGSGTRPPAWVAEVLHARRRPAAGQTAPAAGLTLISVQY
jgi:tRNA pseudouridine38-40 synthase